MGSKLVLQIVIGHVQSLRRSCYVCCWGAKKRYRNKRKNQRDIYVTLAVNWRLLSRRGLWRRAVRGKERRLLESLPICRRQLSFLLGCFYLLLTCGLKTIEVRF